MINKYSAKDIIELELAIEGSVNITFDKSNTDSFFTKIEFENKELVFTETNNNGFYKLEVINPNHEKDLSDLNEIFHNVNNFGDIIKNIAIFGMKHKDMKKDNKSEILNITVELPKKLNKFKLKTNNGLATFNYIDADDVNIKGNNLSAELINDISMKNCTIKTNNTNLRILLTDRLEGMNIKSNNADISFYKTEDTQEIGIEYKGNNVIEQGILKSTRNIIFCKMNNGAIKVNLK